MRQGHASPISEHEPLLSTALITKVTGAMTALALLAGAISYAGHWYGRTLALAGHTDNPQVISVSIGSDTIAVPANMIRFREQRKEGAAERLNLYLAWPEMQGYTQALAARFDQLDLSNSLIFVELTEATMSRDMSGRLEPIYTRLFEGEPEDAGNGLTLHRLRADSGYGGEAVLTATRPGKPDYVVRCVLPVPEHPAGSGDCQRDIHVGEGLSVLYRFSSTLLPAWDHIDAAIATFVGAHLAAEPMDKIQPQS
ncbi:hypothetical protein [Affinirhizobium pseudoryzae]|uniref:hypothetical protein n=1 Tax=Allorhizobium pseudoryzae TaxID=379684 RepID=UPI0013ED4724|nr:hypothetical protein [Allorhizobium pseudoryzae]